VTVRTLLLVALLACGARVASAADAPPAAPVPLARDGFSLKLPQADAVLYRGVVNHDAAGLGNGGMMYLGVGGLAGALVGIATHAVIADSAKSSQKTRLQTAADRVLEPYKDILATITHRDLMAQGLPRVPAEGVKLIPATEAGTGWIVESLPVFSMTDDRLALVLENVVVVYAANEPKTVRYSNVVKVVSNPREPGEPDEVRMHWSDDDGRRLKDESAELFAHSLRLLLEAVQADPAATFAERTVRYTHGEQTRSERAQVMREACGRAVIKSLRGWWISVPLRAVAAPAADAASAVPAECAVPGRYPA
jgi:hypothetical protein